MSTSQVEVIWCEIKHALVSRKSVDSAKQPSGRGDCASSSLVQTRKQGCDGRASSRRPCPFARMTKLY